MNDYKHVPEEKYPEIDTPDSNPFSFDDVDSSKGFSDITPVVPLDKNATWFVKFWRPAIAWQYFVVCLFDFIIAPVLVGIFFYYTGGAYSQWQPLTLMGGGLYHLSMGAIIGVTAYGRTREKLVGLEE